ncbi:hypothetical protein ACIBJI_24645 [Nocardia sp. NPDC050408]|uniref:hypothetical protein n=1 Tax=Nocardia sp. NPDC050408 TaxID=3364319 RepID=UPI0037A0B97A
MTAAAERLREWHSGLAPDGVVVLGLVLTAVRPGRVPASVRRYRDVVAELIEHVYAIGWHDDLVACELSELAEYLPFDPPPRRRAAITQTVPSDVHRTATAIITNLAVLRKPAVAQPDSGTEP